MGTSPELGVFFGGTCPKTKIGAYIKIQQYNYLHT